MKKSLKYYSLNVREALEIVTTSYISVRVLPNRAPTSTQLHPPQPSSFQPPPTSLQHPQQYLNQNIARIWAICPNLRQKTKSCPF